MIELFKSALKAVSDSVYLHFALADYYEIHGENEKANHIYQIVIHNNNNKKK